MRVITTYDVMRAHAARKGTCPTCGRSVTRSRTFTATVNPWNKIGDRPRTYHEVQLQVDAKARAWDPEPAVFRHSSCAELNPWRESAG